MKIEIHLKRVLQENNLDRRGITQKIAKDLKVHRHTVGKLYKNTAANISLSLLGKLCDWLENNGVSRDDLPSALIGSCPNRLWQAIAEPGSVTIYLGEYQEIPTGSTMWRWISKRDAIVATRFVEALSTPSKIGVPAPTVHTEYVPFRWDKQSPNLVQKPFKESLQAAGKIFEQMRSNRKHTSIIIGSQRVNSLLEYFVADLFGCKPFCSYKGEKVVPFYLQHRTGDYAIESCFGGLSNPPGRRGKKTPGIYYLDRDENWKLCPWVQNKEGAGIIITQWDSGTQRLEMAVFGFSGRSTDALGNQLAKTDVPHSQFWPPKANIRGKELGIHICKYTFEDSCSTDDVEDLPVKDLDIIELDHKTLKKYIRR